MTAELSLYGAIEAGGTKFLCEVADHQGRILAARRLPTRDPDTTLTGLLQFFTEQLAPGQSYAGFGIAAFGPLDLHLDSPTYGRILATPKAQWSQTDLLSPLRQHFHSPVAIDTDVNAAALAEARQGNGDQDDCVVYITVGTGIGGGAVIHGRPLHGRLHPEMGHITVRRHAQDRDFPGCCPFHGDCLEGLASGVAITARSGAPLDRQPDSLEAAQVIAYYLAQLACNVILLLSPHRVIFGGGVMQYPGLLDDIRRATARQLKGYAGLGESMEALASVIVPPALGTRSGITGALHLARGADS